MNKFYLIGFIAMFLLVPFGYNILKPLFLRKAKKIASKTSPYISGKMIDVGAGRCLISKEIKNLNKNNIICLDIENRNETELPCLIYDGNKIPFEDNSFDTALVAYVLHHCQNLENTLKEIKRVTKGNIIILEDMKGILTKPCDYIINSLQGIKTPFNFKSNNEWMGVFSELDLRVIAIKDDPEDAWYYPVKQKMYVVT